MTSQTKSRIALFGGVAALAIAFGGGGIAAATDTTLATGATNHSVNVVPAVLAPAAQPTADPTGVQHATLVGCIGGLNC